MKLEHLKSYEEFFLITPMKAWDPNCPHPSCSHRDKTQPQWHDYNRMIGVYLPKLKQVQIVAFKHLPGGWGPCLGKGLYPTGFRTTLQSLRGPHGSSYMHCEIENIAWSQVLGFCPTLEYTAVFYGMGKPFLKRTDEMAWPGACLECKGLGTVPVKSDLVVVYEGSVKPYQQKTCPECKGEGE